MKDLVRKLRGEVGQLTGDKASLVKKVDKVRAGVSCSRSLLLQGYLLRMQLEEEVCWVALKERPTSSPTHQPTVSQETQACFYESGLHLQHHNTWIEGDVGASRQGDCKDIEIKSKYSLFYAILYLPPPPPPPPLPNSTRNKKYANCI